MPALAHIGVALASKKLQPKFNIWILILAAEAVELLFMVLWIMGIEKPPTNDAAGFSPYSHSIVSGILLSLLIGAIFFWITKKKGQSLFITGLALSHTVMDVLASPMLGFYPTDTGKPLFIFDNLSIGLGLYKNPVIGQIFEYSILGLGLFLYILTKIKDRRLQQRSGDKKIT